jgi:hypothetical protein
MGTKNVEIGGKEFTLGPRTLFVEKDLAKLRAEVRVLERGDVVRQTTMINLRAQLMELANDTTRYTAEAAAGFADQIGVLEDEQEAAQMAHNGLVMDMIARRLRGEDGTKVKAKDVFPPDEFDLDDLQAAAVATGIAPKPPEYYMPGDEDLEPEE